MIEDEVVDRVVGFAFGFELGQGGLNGGREGPMFFVFSALFYPFGKQFLFVCREGTEVGVWRGHHETRVLGSDAFQEQGCAGVTRHDSEGSFCHVQRGIGAVGDVEAKMGFAMGGVGAVAFEAFVGEDGADIEVEADCRSGTGIVLVVQAGVENEDGSCDQGKYGSDAADGNRFILKIS